ncbi:hypothetical protein D3C81_1621710 [compost metagenome]
MPPEAQPGLSRTAFGGLLAGNKIDIRRNRDLETEAIGEHLRFEIGAAGAVNMRERTPVMVFGLLAGAQTDTSAAGIDQRLQAFACRHG